MGVLLLAASEATLAGISGALTVAARRAADIDPAAGGVVLCAGDSVTAGFPGGVEQSWPSQLAAFPAVRARGIDLVNLGVSGSTAREAADRVDRVLVPPTDMGAPHAPIAVLFLAGFNDCRGLRAHAPSERGAAFEAVYSQASRLRTYRMLTQVVRRAAGRVQPTAVEPIDAAAVIACKAGVERGIRAVAGRATANRARLAVLTYPLPVRPTPGQPESNWIVPIVNTVIRETAASDGIPLLDAAACVAEREPASLDPLFTRDDLHLTRAGYAEVAACVAPVLSRLLAPE